MVIACIVPYRDREVHWKHFLAHTVPLLVEAGIHTIVAEQTDDGKLFNHGAILNAAVAELLCDKDEFITHDVDVNPSRETVARMYVPPVGESQVRGIYTSHCDTLAPIVKFRVSDFRQCGGMPSRFFGWGAEDRVLQFRVKQRGLNIEKNVIKKTADVPTHFPVIFDDHPRHPPHDLRARTDAVYSLERRSSDTRRKTLDDMGDYATTDYTVVGCRSAAIGVTWLVVALK